MDKEATTKDAMLDRNNISKWFYILRCQFSRIGGWWRWFFPSCSFMVDRSHSLVYEKNAKKLEHRRFEPMPGRYSQSEGHASGQPQHANTMFLLIYTTMIQSVQCVLVPITKSCGYENSYLGTILYLIKWKTSMYLLLLDLANQWDQGRSTIGVAKEDRLSELLRKTDYRSCLLRLLTYRIYVSKNESITVESVRDSLAVQIVFSAPNAVTVSPSSPNE